MKEGTRFELDEKRYKKTKPKRQRWHAETNAFCITDEDPCFVENELVLILEQNSLGEYDFVYYEDEDFANAEDGTCGIETPQVVDEAPRRWWQKEDAPKGNRKYGALDPRELDN